VKFVLGVDPGTRKAGYALVGVDGSIHDRGVEEIGRLADRVHALMGEHTVVAIALGAGTSINGLLEQLTALGVPVNLVDETNTTLKARALYFADHPPRGWRRLLPLGMQMPPRPVDDYAAALIARRYLAGTPGLP
jgi:RNase H-fold protein (predicted Holliday junction resolvase)